MNPFATPTEEIEQAIAILERARELPGTVARRAKAGEAIEVLRSTRSGRKLATVVERFVEDDEIDRAIEVLGKMLEAEGSTPVKSGDTCSVDVHPDPDFPSVTYNCRVAVTCGGHALYGASSDIGYVFCSVRNGAPAMAVDELGSHGGTGSDPMIRMNLPGREVRVSDHGWSVVIDLE